jgi:hypothetical protein
MHAGWAAGLEQQHLAAQVGAVCPCGAVAIVGLRATRDQPGAPADEPWMQSQPFAIVADVVQPPK